MSVSSPVPWLSWLVSWHGGQRTLVGSIGLALKTLLGRGQRLAISRHSEDLRRITLAGVFERSKD